MKINIVTQTFKNVQLTVGYNETEDRIPRNDEKAHMPFCLRLRLEVESCRYSHVSWIYLTTATDPYKRISTALTHLCYFLRLYSTQSHTKIVAENAFTSLLQPFCI